MHLFLLNCCTVNVVAICDLVQDVEQILVLTGICQFLAIGYWSYLFYFFSAHVSTRYMYFLFTDEPSIYFYCHDSNGCLSHD